MSPVKKVVSINKGKKKKVEVLVERLQLWDRVQYMRIPPRFKGSQTYETEEA